MLDKTPYTAGHFELRIDGHASTAYLKSVDGGYVRAAVVDEGIGPTNERVKHTSVADIDPLTIELGMSGAGRVLHWIEESWKMEPSRRNGQITHANFDMRSTFTHEFKDALIAETTFPTLDGAAREAAFLKIKVQPEQIATVKHRGEMLAASASSKQKMWMPSSFRLNIDGFDEMKHTNKIESFTIKQGIKKLWVGRERLPQIVPTKIEFPHIVGTIALEYADRLLEWGQRYLQQGQKDSRAQKNGSIEFLAPDKRRTIFSLNFYEAGLHNLQVVNSTAGSDQIKRLKFELFVGHMAIDPGATGFELG